MNAVVIARKVGAERMDCAGDTCAGLGEDRQHDAGRGGGWPRVARPEVQLTGQPERRVVDRWLGNRGSERAPARWASGSGARAISFCQGALGRPAIDTRWCADLVGKDRALFARGAARAPGALSESAATKGISGTRAHRASKAMMARFDGVPGAR